MVRVLLALVTIAWMTNRSCSDDDRRAFFENRIRPVLVKHCYECHSTGSDERMGELRLDSRPALLQGGESGPAIIPGKPGKSRLLKAIGYQDRDLQMPPDGRLPQSVFDDFEKWIADGAVDPRKADKEPQTKKQFDLISRRDAHWAWKHPRTNPDLTINAKHSIDAFVDAHLAKKNLAAAPPAEPRMLIRRLYFDLIGLPPTPAAVTRFLDAFHVDNDQAVSNLVDQLLEDRRFGEHWARHWLDVIRFSETKGHVTDQEKPYAWKYRDYVIDAFNDDVPYDRFIVEHLAGDRLSHSQIRSGAKGDPNVSVIATGSLFMHEMHFMAVDPVKQRWDEINAQIDVVGKAFLGLTTECARCHDHKFDAISQKDYYALAGIFWSTEQTRARTADRAELEPGRRQRVAELESNLEKFLRQKQDQRRAAQSPKANGKYFPVSEELGIQSPGDTQQLFKRIRALEAEDPSWARWSRAAKNVEAANVPLLIRGEHTNPGQVVNRGFLSALNPNGKSAEPRFPLAPGESRNSGRLWLAKQIASGDNPLTARVWVNRIWHHLFGRGIVATPNNFGKLGASPTHLSLLDFLATQLVRDQWSTKKMIRRIVLSRAYRRTSRVSLEQRNADPENRLVSYFSRRRLTAEQLRDTMLSVSGSLDEKRQGPSVDVYIPPYATGNKPSNIPRSGPLDGGNRRSIYLKVRRNYFDPFLKTFDFPDPGKSIGKRIVTLVPSQSLAMMNSPLVHELASDWGRRIAGDQTALSDRAKLNRIWQTGLQREPTSTELLIAQSLLRTAETERLSVAEKWMQVAHLLFNHPEFMWID